MKNIVLVVLVAVVGSIVITYLRKIIGVQYTPETTDVGQVIAKVVDCIHGALLYVAFTYKKKV